MPVTKKSNLKAVEHEINAIIKRTVEQGADEVLRLVQAEYRKPKTGRLYGRRKALRRFARAVISGRGYRDGKTPSRAGVHQASAPGEAPAIQTGALAKGTARTSAIKLSKFRWIVRLGVTYQSGRATRDGKDNRSIAERLEHGTQRMGGARPAWRTALEVFRNSRR